MWTDRRRLAWAVAAVVVLAAVLRSIGLAYGLPAVYNPDEVAIVNRALSLSQSGLNPHNFLYPTFYFYALLAWEGLWFVTGRLAGVYDSLAAFEASYFLDPSAIYLAGRALTVLCGTATVWAAYRLGRMLFGAAAGFAAAILLAVAPLAVRDAHYVKHDVPVTLLIALTHLVLAADLVSGSGRRRTGVAGLLAGLAMSTHYYALFLAAPLALIALHPRRPGEPVEPRIRRLLTAGATCALAFLAASPFLLAEPATAVRDVIANRQIVVDRATDTSGLFGSLGFYVEWLARDAMGLSAFVLALAGIVTAGLADWRRLGFVLLFPSAFLLFIANTYPASRYLNPILPFAAVLGGAAFGWLWRLPRRGPVTAAIVLAAIALEGILASVRTDSFFRQTDTRTLALDWIETHVPAGESILIQPYSVPLRMSKAALIEALDANLGSADRASIRFRRQLALDPYPAPAYRTIFLGDGGLDADKIYVSPTAFEPDSGAAPLQALGVQWVVLKQYHVDDPAITPLTAVLEQRGRLVASFAPYRATTDADARGRVSPFLHNTDTRIDHALERPGPIVEIWRVD